MPAGVTRATPRLGCDRALFANFFHGELFASGLGSIPGLARAFLHPLALTTVPRRPDKRKELSSLVAVALWPWLAAQEALQRGTASIAGYAGPQPSWCDHRRAATSAVRANS